MLRIALLAAGALAAAASTTHNHHECDRSTVPTQPRLTDPKPLTGYAQRVRLPGTDVPGFVAIAYRVYNRSRSRLVIGPDNLTASFGIYTAKPLDRDELQDLLDEESELTESERRVLELRLAHGAPRMLMPRQAYAGVLLFPVPAHVADEDAILHVFWMDRVTRGTGLATLDVRDFQTGETVAETDDDIEDAAEEDEVVDDADDDAEHDALDKPPRRLGAAFSVGMSKIADNPDLDDDGSAGFAVALDATISLTSWLHTELGIAFSGERTAPSADAPMSLAMHDDLDFQSVELWSALRAQRLSGEMQPYISVGTAFSNTKLMGDGDELSNEKATGLGARVGLDFELTARLALTMSYGYVWMPRLDFSGADDIDVSRSTFLFGLRTVTKGR